MNTTYTGVRRAVMTPRPQHVSSVAQRVLAAEREAWKCRMASQVQFSVKDRPMCQHCGVEEAQHTGKRRKDGSVILRKHQGLYIGANCHNSMYGISHFWGRRFHRDEETAAY